MQLQVGNDVSDRSESFTFKSDSFSLHRKTCFPLTDQPFIHSAFVVHLPTLFVFGSISQVIIERSKSIRPKKQLEAKARNFCDQFRTSADFKCQKYNLKTLRRAVKKVPEKMGTKCITKRAESRLKRENKNWNIKGRCLICVLYIVHYIRPYKNSLPSSQPV